MCSKPSAYSGGIAVLRRRQISHTILALLFPGLMGWNSPVLANPGGGIVVHGDVNIGPGTGGNLQIQQNSRNAIINWESFSINAGELTQFRQPGANAAVLNRVTGGDPSAIHGALKANGNVFVINPNGILVGPGGAIDVHGLVLSTLDVENGEFLARGDLVFKGSGEAGVTNMGRINAIGGDVFLIGKTIVNSGSIHSESGRVGLAAGEEVLLTANETATGERMFVRAKGSGVSGTGIYNDGTIEGAAVELKAHGNVYAMAINNKGSVRATGATTVGGRVYLKAPGGTVHNSGSIRASSSGVGSGGRALIEAAYARVDGAIRAEEGVVRITGTEKIEVGGKIDVSSSVGKGGGVIIEAPEIEVDRGALVDASGYSGGGTIQIGGGFQGRDTSIVNAERVVIDDGATLQANAVAGGSGGKVILWSDGDTLFRGSIEAEGITEGGFVEVSGRENLGFYGAVSTMAADGTAGTLLLDPTNGVVSSSPHAPGDSPFVINNANLVTALGLNNVVISTPSGGSDIGHLTFQDSVIWSSAYSLTALAHGNVVFEASVQNAGAGGVNVIAGWNAPTGFGGSSPFETSGSFDLNDFISNPSSYGKDGGSIYLGDGSQTLGIAVGSRLGTTSLLGDGIHLLGSSTANGYAQVGYRPTATTQASNGAILLRTHGGGLSLEGGSSAGAYAQIGHGGFGSSNTAHEGSIEAISSIAADVLIVAGAATNAYAQIGHGGGVVKTTNKSGDITLESFRNVSLQGGLGDVAGSYAQIGHGGFDSDGALSGTISLQGLSGNVTLSGAGSGTTNIGSYAQIGHGGRGHNGDRSGAVSILTSGNVVMTGGTGGDAYVQIGHGGRGVSNAMTGDSSGAISVTASEISITAGQGAGGAERYAQIGHGGIGATGGDHSGAITVVSTGGDIILGGGATQNAYAHIGHGGRRTAGDNEGMIRSYLINI